MKHSAAHCLIALICLFSLISCSSGQSTTAPPVAPPDPGVVVSAQDKHRGVSWVGGRNPIDSSYLEPLEALNVNWMVQTPFGWMRGIDSPQLNLNIHNAHYWGESDAGLIETNRLAREKQIAVLLKPHIWITQAPSGKWRSDIAMKSEADWQTWFADYRTFMLHYARLAQEQKMAALCVGTELYGTVVTREADWRKLIAEIRTVYDGKLTYAANWYEEYEKVPFWDALDWIGIQAYFPLSKTHQPEVEELIAAWKPHLTAIEAVAKREKKPVLFTEIGYRTTADAAIDPWTWPNRRASADEAGFETQKRLYEAFFQAVWSKPWVGGAYIWKWFPRKPPYRGSSQGFTPQGKPAEQVLLRYYNQ